MSFNDIINNTNNTNNTLNNISDNIVDTQVCNKDSKDEITNISIKSCKNITSKQALLIIPITKYFSNKKTLKKLITILKGESISLRLFFII
jgi:arginine decarboxylase-like protein